MLLGQWRLVDVSLEYPNRVNPEVKDTIKKTNVKRKQKVFNQFYNFKTDGTYNHKIGNREDTGTWLLSNNENVLITRSQQNSRDNNEFLVRELNEFTLILVSEIADKREVLKYEPMR